MFLTWINLACTLDLNRFSIYSWRLLMRRRLHLAGASRSFNLILRVENWGSIRSCISMIELWGGTRSCLHYVICAFGHLFNRSFVHSAILFIKSFVYWTICLPIHSCIISFRHQICFFIMTFVSSLCRSCILPIVSTIETRGKQRLKNLLWCSFNKGSEG